MNNNEINRLIAVSALVTMVGLLFSGPVGLLVTSLIKAQPPWDGAEVFIASYHPVQILPFLFGFVMIYGFVMFISAVAKLAQDNRGMVYASMSMIFMAVYAVIIGLNYALQVAFVPLLVREGNAMAGFFSMANPESVGWVLEMWGYGFLGLSGWLAAPLFKGSRRRRYIRVLLVINGMVSVLGAAITIVDLGWVLSVAGLASYVVWNLLVLAIMVLVYMEFRPGPAKPLTHPPAA